MSFKRDSILIGLYALTITLTINKLNLESVPKIEFVFSDFFDALSATLIALSSLYVWLAGILIRINNNAGPLAVFAMAYIMLFVLYLLSWFLTEIGRSFIKDWGRKGGPGLGIFETWGYCLQANLLYLIAWWLCPVNHRPITNLIYNLNLMHFWPVTIILIFPVGLIPGAVFSGHYRDVFGKILRNYPYPRSTSIR